MTKKMSETCSFKPDIFWFMCKNVLWQNTPPVSSSQHGYCGVLVTQAYGIDTKWDSGYLKHIRKYKATSGENGLKSNNSRRTHHSLRQSLYASTNDNNAKHGNLTESI